MINHGRRLAVETMDIAAQHGMFLDEHGKAIEVDPSGQKINTYGLTVVDDGSPAIQLTKEQIQLEGKLRKRIIQRQLIESDSQVRAQNAHALERENHPEYIAAHNGQPVQQSEGVQENSIEAVWENLTLVDGIGLTTAKKLVEFNVYDYMDMVGLTVEQLYELDISRVNAPKVVKWLEDNVEQVADD